LYNGIILSKNGCDPYSPKALRASMGALLRIPVIETEDFCGTLVSSELPLYGCVVDKDADSVTNLDFSKGAIALIGNEANGLSNDAKAISKPVTIKMTGRAESLNAAVAASIVMWEMCR
jgi:TrmH family RNA methyltransferase